jgi:hypothetical protein
MRFYPYYDHDARQQRKRSLHRKLKKVLAQKTQSGEEAPKAEAGVKIVGISIMYNAFAKNLMIENSSLKLAKF